MTSIEPTTKTDVRMAAARALGVRCSKLDIQVRVRVGPSQRTRIVEVPIATRQRLSMLQRRS